MKARLLLLSLAGIVLAGCTNPLANLSLAKKSGLQVTSIPQATVFLDGNSLGTTPVREEDLKPGEHTVKLVPQDSSLQAYEAKIKLTPGVLTAIDRTLAAGPNDANGYTLSFEPLSNKRDVVLDIATSPDSVTVSIDNTPQGFTPKSIDSIAAGDHVILFSSPGFIDKTVRAKAIAGYRLTVNVQLAKAPTPAMITPEASPSAELSPGVSPTIAKVSPAASPSSAIAGSSTPTKPYVEIGKSNATSPSCEASALRVRPEPRTDNTEIAWVCEGDTFPYLNKTQNGFYLIEYETGKEGWVAKQYAKLN